MATPELIAGMTAVLDGKEPPAPEPVVTDAPEGDPAPDAPKEDLLGDDPPAAKADAPEGKPEGEPEPAEGGPVRGPDGKFIAKDKGDGKEPEPKPEEPKAAEAPKEVDPLNDPLPDGKKERSERFQTLVGMVKEKDAELSTVTQDMEMLLGPIREANATPEQFREAMTLVKLLNSPHQHEQMQALKYLNGAGSALAERLGQPVPGADPLAGHNDLIAKVNAGKLSEQDAVELANARRQAAAAQQFQRTAAQRSQQEQQTQQAVQQGQAAVRAVEQTLQATDPQYTAKVDALRKDAAFMSQMKTMPPTQWAAAFAEKYRTIKVAAPAAPAARPAAPASPAPLRAKTPAGTAAKPHGSTLDAVRAGLAAAGGG